MLILTIDTEDEPLSRRLYEQFYMNIYEPILERVHHHEHESTGLFEDLHDRILLFIDHTMDGIRDLIRFGVFGVSRDQNNQFQRLVRRNYLWRLFESAKGFCRHLWSGFSLFQLPGLSIWNQANAEEEPDITKETIENAGYPYESMKVTTEDGYILTLQRIPRPDSKKILYFQHGLLDSSSAFIASGGVCGLAYSAYDKGYDVYLGNLRGAGACEHTNRSIKDKDYWNFSVNEFGLVDIPTFVNEIRSRKAKELPNESATDLHITAVCHSLGAAALMFYLTSRCYNKQKHYISRAILLSPAGCHNLVPFSLKVILSFLQYVTCPLVYAYKLPKGALKELFSKILQDLKNMPATLDLISFFTTMFFGGDAKKSIVRTIDFRRYSLFGASRDVILHGIQCWRSGKFRLFDYGRAKNILVYGSPEPTDILSRYKIVDIPIYFLAGGMDNIIPVPNILRQYNALWEHRPDLAHLRVFPDLNHIDFTLSPDDVLLEYVTSLF
eukprot:TRINITY_DN3115_c0_g1_i6.p1 TRINITY_DN3115_c0_g1~~TRINITY_DN3115_c0_g1_i6.p1  ORF type:complete len:497 (-),score=72.75 TRINITY_DN3115_c0_g1_i6:193-1683(-)